MKNPIIKLLCGASALVLVHPAYAQTAPASETAPATSPQATEPPAADASTVDRRAKRTPLAG